MEEFADLLKSYQDAYAACRNTERLSAEADRNWKIASHDLVLAEGQMDKWLRDHKCASTGEGDSVHLLPVVKHKYPSPCEWFAMPEKT